MICSARASRSIPSLVNTCTSIIVPACPEGTLKLVSLTSEAFSPNIALNNFSSGVSCVSPFGVTFPTRTSPASTSAPIWIMPASSSLPSILSDKLEMSLVISSGPSFVSLATTCNSSI